MAEGEVTFSEDNYYGNGLEFYGLFSLKVHVTFPKDDQYGQVHVNGKEEIDLRFIRIIPKDCLTMELGYKSGLWLINGEHYGQDKSLIDRIKELLKEMYSVRRNRQ